MGDTLYFDLSQDRLSAGIQHPRCGSGLSREIEVKSMGNSSLASPTRFGDRRADRSD